MSTMMMGGDQWCEGEEWSRVSWKKGKNEAEWSVGWRRRSEGR